MDSKSILSLTWIVDLYRIGQGTSSPGSGERAPQDILEHIVSGFQATSGSLSMTEADGKSLRIVAGVGLPGGVLGSTIAYGERIIGWVAQTQQPLRLLGDISSDPRFLIPEKREQARTPIVALCWPLLLGGRLLGVLSINRDQGSEPFTDEDQKRAVMFGNVIALVLENLELHRNAQASITGLSAAKESLQCIIDSLTSHIAVIDANGGIIQVNAAWQKFAHQNGALAGREGVGVNYLQVCEKAAAEEQVTAVARALREILQGKRNWYWMEYPCHSPDQQRWFVMSATPLGSPVHGVVVSHMDITERKLAEQELGSKHALLQDAYSRLEQAQSQLLQSEKMASIGQLAAGVAHEINNPVGYVNSNIGTLQGYVNDLFRLLDAYHKAEPLLAADPALKAEIDNLKQTLDLAFLREDTLNLVKESQEGITRVRKIVQDLKEFSHVDEAEWQQTNLHAGLDSTLNILHNETKYKAEIIKDYGDIPAVECIASQINQVFLNLLVNAAQAIDTRGTITLRTGSENDGVFVEISDTGKGITPEHLKRIFEPFFTTKPVGKGTGLGLSLSYGIVKKHGGRIDVSSTPGQGTRFRVWLPVRRVGAGETETVRGAEG